MNNGNLALNNCLDENDFIKRKTNQYAKINDEYYLQVSRRIPEELVRINDIFRFYYCRVRKIGEHSFKEEAFSNRYIVAEEIMTGKDYLKISSPHDNKIKKDVKEIEYFKNLIICVNSFLDENGTIFRYASLLLIGETILRKPKSLTLIH